MTAHDSRVCMMIECHGGRLGMRVEYTWWPSTRSDRVRTWPMRYIETRGRLARMAGMLVKDKVDLESWHRRYAFTVLVGMIIIHNFFLGGWWLGLGLVNKLLREETLTSKLWSAKQKPPWLTRWRLLRCSSQWGVQVIKLRIKRGRVFA